MADDNTQPQNQKVNTDNPKNRLLRLFVGIIVITLGIIFFNVASHLWQKAEEKDAKEQARQEAERAEKIHEITGE